MLEFLKENDMEKSKNVKKLTLNTKNRGNFILEKYRFIKPFNKKQKTILVSFFHDFVSIFVNNLDILEKIETKI